MRSAFLGGDVEPKCIKFLIWYPSLGVRVCARWSVCVSIGGTLCGGYQTYRFVELKNLGYLQRSVPK